MYLFSQNKNKIDVYEVLADTDKLKQYRKKILDTYQEHKLFYTLKSNVSETVFDFIDLFSINQREIEYVKETPKKKKYYSKLLLSTPIKRKERKIQKEVLEKYINGEYQALYPLVVYQFHKNTCTEEELYYFLRPHNEVRHPREWHINNIISLPKELYLLQLLELGSTGAIPRNEDLSDQLKLYTKKKIGSANMDKLELLINTDIVRQSMNSIYERLEIDEPLLKKIKTTI